MGGSLGALPTSMKWLMGAGGLCCLIWAFLLWRMVGEVNTALPPDQKFSRFFLRERFFDIKRLHEELHPTSKLRTAWFLFVLASQILIGLFIVVGVSER